MAFITVDNTVISFAIFEDATNRDQRLFEANEGLTEELVEDMLIRSTERILAKIRATSWWVDYYADLSGGSFRTKADIPAVNPNLIIDRQSDFTDLCVYSAFFEYVMPKVADFGNEEDAAYQKITYYKSKADGLFDELIRAGDWYDFDNDGVIASSEKKPGPSLVNYDRMVRVR